MAATPRRRSLGSVLTVVAFVLGTVLVVGGVLLQRASRPDSSAPLPGRSSTPAPPRTPSPATGTSGVTPGPPAAAGLSVSGNRLYKDGMPYVPRGFNMIGLLTPSWCRHAVGAAAHAKLGPAEMDAAGRWHATMLRFQVSQRGLADPTVSAADRGTYLRRVEAGVALARSYGFDVILSMQDQSIGCGPAHPFPTRTTEDAWKLLAPVYASDPYVMFELFNEPNADNTAAGWAQWRLGGTNPSTNLGEPAVGHQSLLDDIRGWGAGNVVIADALNMGERLSGLTPLKDHTGDVVYAIHPYYYTAGPRWWDAQYGGPTTGVPVIATEWNYGPTRCGSSYQTLGPTLLRYLGAQHIGVLGQAFDIPGTTVTAIRTWAPTQCGSSSGGSGADLLAYFAETAGIPGK